MTPKEKRRKAALAAARARAAARAGRPSSSQTPPEKPTPPQEVEIKPARRTGRARFFPSIASRWPLFAILALVLIAAAYSIDHYLRMPVIRADGEGYYSYLRLYLVYHTLDFGKLPTEGPPELAGLVRVPESGRIIDIYQVGTAIAELPFFVAAHLLAIWKGWKADGLSQPYQRAIVCAGVCWLLIGVSATWLVVRKRVGPRAASVATLTIVFGTNVWHYATVDGSMSHVYAFAVLALMLWLGDRFWAAPSGAHVVPLALAAGLLVCIRNYDVFFVPLVLYPACFRSNRDVVKAYLARFAGWSCVAVLPQCVAATYYLGAPWASGHRYGSFNWLHPLAYAVLFSVRKGWFFWTPAAAVGVIGLIYGLRGQSRWFCVSALSGIAAMAYVLAVWGAPYAGSSFGHRGFVDCLPVIAVGIGLISNWLVGVTCTACIVLNVLLMVSYWDGDLGGDRTTWRTYTRVVAARLHLQGAVPNDSSTRDHLASRIEAFEFRRDAKYLTVTVSVRNTGSAVWLGDAGKGQVVLRVRPCARPDCEDQPLWEWHQPIPFDIAPSQQARLEARVPLSWVNKRFEYLCAELGAEAVAWFRDVGSPPVIVHADDSVMRWSELFPVSTDNK